MFSIKVLENKIFSDRKNWKDYFDIFWQIDDKNKGKSDKNAKTTMKSKTMKEKTKTIKVCIINSNTSQNYTFNKINQYISLFQAGQKLDKRIRSDRLVNYNFSL